MAFNEMTPGETARNIARLDEAARAMGDRVTSLAKSMVPADVYTAQHQAVVQGLADLKSDTRDAFDRVEKTSLERRAALQEKDNELAGELGRLKKAVAEQNAALRSEMERKVADLKREIAAERKAERERENVDQSRGTTKVANIIAAVVALVAVATLVVTLAGQGGR